MTTARSGKLKSFTSGKSKSAGKRKEDLLREIEELRARLEEAESTVQAIQTGEVDAIIISGPDGEKVFSLEGADYPYRVIVEIMSEGVITLSADGGILSCNTRFANFAKMPSPAILGKQLASFATKEDRPKLQAFLKEAADHNCAITATLAAADGTNIPVTLSGVAFEAGGLPALCIVVTDMTERKRAEKDLQDARDSLEERVVQRTQELKAANTSLRDSGNRLYLALHAAKMATWDWHVRTGETVWDDEYYRMLGYDVGEVKPSFEAWISRVHPEDRETIATAFLADKNEGLRSEAEFRTCWPDGTVHWQWALGGVDRDATKQVVRYYGVLLDISEKKAADQCILRLNEALKKHGASLEFANKELESFSHSVSHDLRTPLRFMNKIANILLHDYDAILPGGATEMINMIINATREMETLIEVLLTFSRIISAPITKKRVNLQKLVREAIKELRNEQSGRVVEFQMDELPPCQVDCVLFKQVFLNLLGNSLKFTRPREKAQIRIGSMETAGETVYFIEDNGIGFDMGKSDSLFVAFHRLHKASEYEGSGIGLALVKRIVERHNGRIWCKSEIDKGATVYFTVCEKTPQ